MIYTGAIELFFDITGNKLQIRPDTIFYDDPKGEDWKEDKIGGHIYFKLVFGGQKLENRFVLQQGIGLGVEKRKENQITLNYIPSIDEVLGGYMLLNGYFKNHKNEWYYLYYKCTKWCFPERHLNEL